ncbi:MAG: hypothetical protein U0165_03975 [Polyangiaceae bacterium]
MARATVESSIFESNVDVGMVTLGGELTVDSSYIAKTFPAGSDGSHGGGISVQGTTSSRASATLSNTTLTSLHSFGVMAAMADITMSACTLREVDKDETSGSYGDAILAVNDADLSIDGCSIDGAARVAISAFGARASIHDVWFGCNGINLDDETLVDGMFGYSGEPLASKLINSGGNLCRCGDRVVACAVTSSSLTPPAAVHTLPPPASANGSNVSVNAQN